MPDPEAALDAAAARRWAQEAASALAADRDAIDRINVYPVADGDTGTNLLQTIRCAVDALPPAAEHETLGGVLAALAKGAVNGARGNSGMLLSQVLRGLAETLRDADSARGELVRRALLRADELAKQALSEPAEGTLLSVLHAAAVAVALCDTDDLAVVVREATLAASRALAETTDQLPVLAEAGVVDAGGRGLVVLLDALHAVVHGGVRLAREAPFCPPGVDFVRDRTPVTSNGYTYEVMYLVSGADEARIATLREDLGRLGDCVSVISDGDGSWAVHVHCDDIGAALESGLLAGRAHQIRVTPLPAGAPAAAPRARAVLACVRGDALAELFRSEGAVVLAVDPTRPPDAGALHEAIERADAAHVLVLPNGEVASEVAEDVAGRAEGDGRDVVLLPTLSPVQGLAALAVHDPHRRAADDAVAMAESAAATRRGELLVAEAEALTWVGRCQPGDVLAMVDGDVVLIGADLVEVARELADRMLGAGGELLTALVGDDAPDGLAEVLERHLRRTHPEVEFTCYPGGSLGAVLLLGVE